jgi:hypothetical protein
MHPASGGMSWFHGWFQGDRHIGGHGKCDVTIFNIHSLPSPIPMQKKQEILPLFWESSGEVSKS